MDKRVLSSNRDIRGKKRAVLSEERTGIEEGRKYNKPTIHELFSKFIEIKRSEGISDI